MHLVLFAVLRIAPRRRCRGPKGLQIDLYGLAICPQSLVALTHKFCIV